MKNTLGDRRGIQLVEHDDNRKLWSISSASGRERFLCAVLSDAPYQGVLVCSLRVEGSFWDRSRHLSSADIIPDFDVCLAQVLVDVECLEDLRKRFEEWLRAGTHFECRLNASKSGGQELIVSVGADPGLIYVDAKPAFMIEYSAGAFMTGKWSFIVDQSCVRLAIEALEHMFLLD